MRSFPPSRYQVVERGRRLVVIDRQTGRPAAREPALHDRAVAGRPAERPGARPIEASPGKVDDRSGAAILTTSPFYDLKAPRRIVMDDRFNERFGKLLGGWLIGGFVALAVAFVIFPWLIVLPVVLLFQPKARAAIRLWITARLDEVQAAS
jgi:hypothetical protein